MVASMSAELLLTGGLSTTMRLTKETRTRASSWRTAVRLGSPALIS
ncbi:hypothetical protein [Streptomyces goshikiensis]